MDGKADIDRSSWVVDEFVDIMIEKVSQFQGSDNSFITEMRVLTGPQKGSLKSNLWFKTKKDGNPRKDTESLMTKLIGSMDEPIWKLKDKSFRCKPWYPDGSQYPVFTSIEKIDCEEPNFEDLPF